MDEYEYHLSVGEPWNFVSQDGKNIIKGDVICKLHNKLWVFKSNHPVHFGNVNGNVFVLLPRHTGFYFSNWVDDLVVINGYALCTEYNDNLTEQDMIANMGGR